MSFTILTNQIQNLQQVDAVVSGPDGANRLFNISGQFDMQVAVWAQSAATTEQSETFRVLIGPVLTRRQFVKSIATASITKTGFYIQQLPLTSGWQVIGVDADWDDESGQVEVRIEIKVQGSGQGNNVIVSGAAFYCTILAELQA